MKIAIEYCIHVSSLLFEKRNQLTCKMLSLNTSRRLLEAFTVMEKLPLSGVIPALKEDAEFQLIPLIMPEISEGREETETWIEKRKAHQKESLDKMAAERKNSGQDQTFLGRYRTEKDFLRAWATVIADKKIGNMSKKDQEMLFFSICKDLASPVLGKVVAEVVNKTSLNVKAAFGGEESLTFISSVSPDLIMKIVKAAVVDVHIQHASETKGRGFELQRMKLRMK